MLTTTRETIRYTMHGRRRPPATKRLPEVSEGLRERKKRLMRQLISDTATEMFLERGLRRGPGRRDRRRLRGCRRRPSTTTSRPRSRCSSTGRSRLAESIRRALGPGAAPPRRSRRGRSDRGRDETVLRADSTEFADRWTSRMIRSSRTCIESTPSLRAAQRDMMDRLVQVAAEAMAARAGVDPDDPEPQIAAHAILGLWRVQFRPWQVLRRQSHRREVRDAVIDDVRRAARLIDTGLWSFGMAVQGSNSREQFKTAAKPPTMPANRSPPPSSRPVTPGVR